MIKKIGIDALTPGMFIHDMNCEWLDHPFLRNRLRVKNEKTIEQIRAIGIREIYIDTSLGLDAVHAPTLAEVETGINKRLEQLSEIPAITESDPSSSSLLLTGLSEELTIARTLHRDAKQLIQNLMTDIRFGEQIERERVDPMVHDMIDSIFRNKNALLPLANLKHHDSYTFEHSVSTCALMIVFARHLQMDRASIHEVALGALLHDVGKAQIPDEILNKPAKLTDAELEKMRSHVVQSIILLQHTAHISDLALQTASQHHERFDGSGYPNGLKGEENSIHGQMASIVDVYDALSSDRAYHKGRSPATALRKLLEWSEFHFQPRLVHTFIRAIGIYPSGSLVRLESNRLAIVLEQNEKNLLHPLVQVIYHIDRQYYLQPEVIDLAHSQDRIVSHESFAQWNLNPKTFMLTH